MNLSGIDLHDLLLLKALTIFRTIGTSRSGVHSCLYPRVEDPLKLRLIACPDAVEGGHPMTICTTGRPHFLSVGNVGL